jgi:hypothetical protein
VDWRPEREIQAKVRDLKEKKQSMTAKAHLWEKHSDSVCKWRLLLDFCFNGLYPQEVFISPLADALCRAWPWYWLNSSAMMLSSMKTVEWLYGFVGPLPNLHVQSCLVQLYTVTLSYKYKFRTHIHTYFIHPFIHTYIIHLYLHAYKHSYIHTTC